MTVEERNKHILENKIVNRKYPKTARFKDLSGKVFNGIKLIRYVGKSASRVSYYECECTCGNIFIDVGSRIKSGVITSCGCKYMVKAPKIVDTSYPNSKCFNNLYGKKINNIQVLEYVGKDKRGRVCFKCRCRCGKIFTTLAEFISSKRVSSCGCNRRGVINCHNNTHRGTDPVYNIYQSILNTDSVCSEWSKGRYAFETFRDWMISQGFSKNKNILRKDPNKEYSPDNCILVSSELTKKFKSNNHYVTVGKYSYPVSVWSMITGLNVNTIYARINVMGWSDRDVVLTPSHGRRGLDVINLVIPPEIERLNGCGQ